MKISIMGTRGIPACYGGFETFAEEIAIRLVKKGHDVTVYGRSNIIKNEAEFYKGVRLKILPTISHKYLDTITNTFLSIMHSINNRYDVILLCNAANSIFAFIPRIFKQKVIINVDGIERYRKKWNWLGKLWYLMGEFFACIFPNATVTDANVVKNYYLKKYYKKTKYIPYGTKIEKINSGNMLKKFKLQPKKYFLYVSRFEPENNGYLVIKAFEKVKTNMKLVMVGSAPYSDDYIKKLKETKDKRIIFTGGIYGKGYIELQSHAYCYIHAAEVGGVHPGLVESMGLENCVIANDTPENVETLGDCGLIYKKNDLNDLIEKINFVINNSEIIEKFSELAKDRAIENYSWDAVTSEYEKLFLNVLNGEKIV